MTKELFGKIILENEKTLYRVAKSILPNDEDCADAVSEAITKGFEKLSSLKKDEYAMTGLIRIVMNECYEIHRKNRWVDDDEDALLGIESSAGREQYNDLYAAIDTLSEKQRIIVLLYHIEGYSIKEVAQIMKTTIASVRMNLSRARKNMRLYLEG